MTDKNLIVRHPRLVHVYGLITTRVGLRLPLQSSFFQDSKAVVKCISTISPGGFWGSPSGRGSDGSISSSSSSSSSSIVSSLTINGPGGGRKESLAQATRHHSVIDSREDTFIGECVALDTDSGSVSLLPFHCCNWSTDDFPPFALSISLSFTVHSFGRSSSVASSSLIVTLLVSLWIHQRQRGTSV